MAGIAPKPRVLSAFPTVGFFTRWKDSVFARRKARPAKARPRETSFDVRTLIDKTFVVIEFNEKKEMIRASSSRLSDEMVDILAALVMDGT
jgi:hypothetical protein